MHRKLYKICVCLILVLSALSKAGCSKDSTSTNHTTEKRSAVHTCLMPEASGTVTYGNDSVSIDASNISEGYVMVRYTGTSDKVKLTITIPDSSVYTYTLSADSYETFPLPGGDGSYHLEILEHAYDDMYALAFSQDIDAVLSDEFKPFLYPNQFVWFTQEYKAAALGIKLSDQASSDLDYVEQVYLYVTKNIRYDDKLAAEVKAGYIPDIDAVLESKKGICFDYASLMAALLRSQGIPTKLVIGYAGEAYHAWISVYLKEAGWIDNVIQFDGTSWSLVDPTFAANNTKESVKKYIGSGSHYIEKYFY